MLPWRQSESPKNSTMVREVSQSLQNSLISVPASPFCKRLRATRLNQGESERCAQRRNAPGTHLEAPLLPRAREQQTPKGGRREPSTMTTGFLTARCSFVLRRWAAASHGSRRVKGLRGAQLHHRAKARWPPTRFLLFFSSFFILVYFSDVAVKFLTTSSFCPASFGAPPSFSSALVVKEFVSKDLSLLLSRSV